MSDDVTSSATVAPAPRPESSGPPQAPLRPPGTYGAGPSGRDRAIALGAVVAAHLAAGWGLLQVDAVREAVGEAAPVFVEFLTVAPPPPPVPVPPPPPPPPQPKPRPKEPPPPAPIVTAPPSPAPAPFVAPPPPVEPPAPPAPIVPLVPPAPPAPPAPPPPEPRTVSISQLELAAPITPPVYPAQSSRLGESGRVVVRVLFDATGRPVQAQVTDSSGFSRLDDAAVRAARTARIKPFLVGGEPQPVWARIPFDFNLDN